MDENTWRLAQILIWVIGAQTGILAGILGAIWCKINANEVKSENSFKELGSDLKEVADNLNKIDKRLVAVETILHMKECCMLKEEKNLKKAG